MIEHFFRLLSYTMGVTLHLKTKGKTITTAESLFKAFGRTLRRHPRGRRHPALVERSAVMNVVILWILAAPI